MKREKMYAICGLYHVGQEFKGENVFYGKQMFLGVEDYEEYDLFMGELLS